MVSDRHICEMTYEDGRAVADARLIAAAPEMFSLLLQIGVALKNGEDIIARRDKVVLAKIQGLVAQASGRTNEVSIAKAEGGK